MKILIEIDSGIVTGVFCDEDIIIKPEIYVFDHDNNNMGENPIYKMNLERLKYASPLVRVNLNLLKDSNKK